MCTHAHSTTHEPAGDVVRPGTRHDAARGTTRHALRVPGPRPPGCLRLGRSTVAAALWPQLRRTASAHRRGGARRRNGGEGGGAARRRRQWRRQQPRQYLRCDGMTQAAVRRRRWWQQHGSGRQGHDLHNSNIHRHHNQRCSYGRSGAFETVQSYFVEEVVVGRKAHDNHATTKTDSCRRSTSVRPLEHDVVQSADSNSGSLPTKTVLSEARVVAKI